MQAMLGFAADLIGEQLTGKGPLAQIGLGTGQPLNPELAGFGLAVWVGFFALAAVGFGKLGEQTGQQWPELMRHWHEVPDVNHACGRHDLHLSMSQV